MLRLFVLAVALTVLSPASGQAAEPTPAPKAAAPLNIGFVLYTRSDTPGVLKARWNYGNAYSGLGLATGGPATGGFVGRYHVRYFLETGEFSDEYDLEIQKHAPGDFYDVTWITDGKVSARGIGLEVEGGKSLAVGWRRVAD